MVARGTAFLLSLGLASLVPSLVAKTSTGFVTGEALSLPMILVALHLWGASSLSPSAFSPLAVGSTLVAVAASLAWEPALPFVQAVVAVHALAIALVSEKNDLIRAALARAGAFLVVSLSLASIVLGTETLPGLLSSGKLSRATDITELPLTFSSAQHSPATWSLLFFDLHLAVVAAPAGLLILCRDASPHALLLISAALVSMLFAAFVGSLASLFAPFAVVLASLGLADLLALYVPAVVAGELDGEDDAAASKAATKKDRRNQSRRLPGAYKVACAIVFIVASLLASFALHSVWVATDSFGTASSAIATKGKGKVLDDFREAYTWLKANATEDDLILAPWDHGLQVVSIAGRRSFLLESTQDEVLSTRT